MFEKLVDQYRSIGSKADRIAHVSLKSFLIVDDRHRASAEYITRSHENGIADALRHLARLFNRRRHTVLRLRYAKLVEQGTETFAIFSEIDRVRRSADNFDARFLQTHREVQRCLTAKLNYHALRFLDVDDVHHVFERERLEVKTIGSI